MSSTDPRPEGEVTSPDVVTIVRYPNRRLYDKSLGKYVTLRDVEERVRQGGTVLVRDSKTGEDLTRTVLTQIILEQHPERMDLFPASFLHLVIRANTALLGFLREYVRQSLAYVELMQRAAPLNPLAAPAEWLRAFMPGLPPRNEPAKAAPPDPSRDADVLSRRIADLERRLEELLAAAGKPGPNAGPRPRPGKR